MNEYFDTERMSDCCGVYIFTDTDICSKCRDHCGDFIDDDDKPEVEDIFTDIFKEHGLIRRGE